MRSEGNRPRVVVDSNLFVSALITRRGIPHDLLNCWRDGRFTLLMSEDQRGELADVFSRPRIKGRYRLSDEEIAGFFLLLDTLSVPAPLLRRLPLHVRDPKDDHVLAAALGARADFLVTGDADLLELEGDPKVRQLRIITAARFLEWLSQMSNP